MAEQLFNFITLRPPELIARPKLRLRYIKDLRTDKQAKFRSALVKQPILAKKVIMAKRYLKRKWDSPTTGVTLNLPNFFFYSSEHYFRLGMDDLVRFIRDTIKNVELDKDGNIISGVKVDEIITEVTNKLFWLEASYFNGTIEEPQLKQMAMAMAAIWNSLYSLTILATIQHTETNYITDSIRALYCVFLLRELKANNQEYWTYPYIFDDFEIVIPENLF